MFGICEFGIMSKHIYDNENQSAMRDELYQNRRTIWNGTQAKKILNGNEKKFERRKEGKKTLPLPHSHPFQISDRGEYYGLEKIVGNYKSEPKYNTHC